MTSSRLPGDRRALWTEHLQELQSLKRQRVVLSVVIAGLSALVYAYENIHQSNKKAYQDVVARSEACTASLRQLITADETELATLSKDLADKETELATARRELVDYTSHALASSYLDDETVAELQRDIHAVLSADPAIAAEIGTNLRINRPYYADLTPPFPTLSFGCSGSKARGAIYAMMHVPPPSYDLPLENLVPMGPEEFREVVATPQARFCSEIEISEIPHGRPMAVHSRFDVVALECDEKTIELIYTCTDAERDACRKLVAEVKAQRLARKENEGSEFEQDLE